MLAEIHTVTGDIRRAEPLKNRVQRLRARWLPDSDQHPLLYRIEATDGALYKLMRAPAENRELAISRHNLSLVQGLEFFPKVLHQGPEHILLEYVEGHIPEAADRGFASMLGVRYARLHALEVREEAPEAFMKDIETALHGLQNELDIDLGEAGKAISLNVPPVLKRSMEYIDAKPKNFIRSEDQLYFIDGGALRSGVLTGAWLLACRVYPDLDWESFFKAYQEAGGDPWLRQSEKFLRWTKLVQHAWFNHLTRDRVAWWDRRLRRAKLRRRDQAIAAIIEETRAALN